MFQSFLIGPAREKNMLTTIISSGYETLTGALDHLAQVLGSLV
ncbi:hypothetical protein [Amycolatopsis anabasis]|nr:hypothetical protein [Amycolatopsis anabasis]